VKRSAPAAIASVVVGGVFAAAAGVALALAFSAAPEVTASLAPRSVTTPVAMGVAERIGGLPSLTAAIVICSGIVGAALGPALLTLLGVTDWRARGLAIGTAAHGIGTARAISVNEVAGAFSGLAMGLNALATALLLPLLWRLFFG
jgi:putative effector of murein hydrolase